jgi:CRISPR-associated protein (TIGR02710 family)
MCPDKAIPEPISSSLEQLMSADDFALVKAHLAVFESAGAERGELIEAANHLDIFRLERKYVPITNARQAREIDCDTLISTVGLRPQPVILTILCLQPKKVFLLHTEISRKMAEGIRDDPDLLAIGLRPNLDTVLKPISETDAPRNYDLVQNEILPAASGRVVIDPTGGLKIMGVSMTAMAFWRRLPMVYLKGVEKAGVVIPFSEELTRVENPYEHFGDRDLALIKAFFERGNYSAAEQVCSQLLDTIGDPAGHTRVELLRDLARLYGDWDAFMHSLDQDLPQRRLGEQLQDIKKRMKRFSLQVIDERALEQNIRFLQLLENSWRKSRNIVDAYRLVDIYINAERKFQAGNYDDAVARLYRCMEMCSTILLKEWKIGKTSKPDLAKINAHLGAAALEDAFQLAYHRSISPPWGLDDQMKVLALVAPKHPVPNIYLAMSKAESSVEEAIMNKRNRSILAHGTAPVVSKDCETMRSKVHTIIGFTVGQDLFNELLQTGKHAKLLI